MAPRTNNGASQKPKNRGAWTAEEDGKLAEYVEVHGAKRWKTVALRAGLNRCGKSCRLRWLNYLRPNIKRGNISDDEEDLILRLHRLLGNRWSLIAGRLPGRTDNEIKNYWNSHLSKKINQNDKTTPYYTPTEVTPPQKICATSTPAQDGGGKGGWNTEVEFDEDDFFDFSMEGSYGLDWVNEFLELDEKAWVTGN